MPHNVSCLLKDTVDQHPDRLALKTAFESLTYKDLWNKVTNAALKLEASKMAQSPHIGLYMNNRAEFTIYYYAILALGRVVIPINPMLKAEELAYQILDADAFVVVTTKSELPTLNEALKNESQLRQKLQSILVADETDPTSEEWSESTIPDRYRENHNLDFEQNFKKTPLIPFPVKPTDTAVILYTSGTTGKPKGAELTHFNLTSNVESLKPLKELLYENSWRALLTLPLYHSFGQTVVQNTTFAVGGSLYIMERFDPWQAAQWIQSETITFYAGVPTMYYGLLHHPSITSDMLKSLCICISGGAPLPEEVMRRFQSTFKTQIIEAYGLSETAPVASMNPLFGNKKIGSIGVPIEGVEFKLVDENGSQITKPFVTGELCIKGPNVMKGYYKKPSETALVLKDSWFRSGDLAQRDEAGYYKIVDRAKDMIIRGGYNVYPREVEERLYHHPDVLEAAVVGIQDERLGEEVCGLVTLRPGAKTTEAELIDYCRTHLAAYKYPRAVQIVETLPKGPTGKILKRVLKKEILSKLDKKQLLK